MAIIDHVEKVSDTVWELPPSYKEGMRVPARIIATEKLVRDMDEAVYQQISNVATLPGITRYALCMPDGHSGYGFPIGGVAAMDVHEGGVISPGGIGFDINCGMRLITTNLTLEDVQPRLKEIVDRLFHRVPAGVGTHGFLKLSHNEFRDLVKQGARWCVERDLGWQEDLEFTEENGCIAGADASKISERDKELAKKFGITIPNQIVVMFHCGSRGFGHQVATDYLLKFLKVMEPKYGIKILDRELACAPFDSPEGRDYFAAMKCGLNMSFANRQVILHRIREVFSEIFGRSAEDLDMRVVYDVSHNTAKLERHMVDGREKTLLVHRKGSTRAFGPGHDELPARYRETGQPVIIGGSMETGSYLLVGTSSGSGTFFSTAHGSGRTMSRTKARKQWNGKQLQRDLEARGIYVRSTSWAGLAEEAGGAYKDIDEVIAATELAGISKPVARFTPIGNVKG